MQNQSYTTLGVMSGTSLDGLDLALCQFSYENGQWQHSILQTSTIPYSIEWQKRLVEVETASALTYVKTDWALGRYIGQQINEFLENTSTKPDCIASHGHTIFHQPEGENGFTAQIGNGAAIAAVTELTVINDFRIADVALGGQGAPLVPIGDRLLFSDYQFCLNLGGIANISTAQKNITQAYDICACNMALNYIANLAGMPYDDKGQLAASGNLLPELLKALNELPYFKINGPKSLGKEWFLAEVLPILQKYSAEPKDLAHTFVHHISFQIAQTCNQFKNELPQNPSMLITGGGAYHQYLIKCMQTQMPWLELKVPEATIVEFKEAIIFAFLGVLRLSDQNNCLASVTGASKDNLGGVIHKLTN